MGCAGCAGNREQKVLAKPPKTNEEPSQKPISQKKSSQKVEQVQNEGPSKQSKKAPPQSSSEPSIDISGQIESPIKKLYKGQNEQMKSSNGLNIHTTHSRTINFRDSEDQVQKLSLSCKKVETQIFRRYQVEKEANYDQGIFRFYHAKELKIDNQLIEAMRH